MAHEDATGKWLYFSKLWEKTGFWRTPLPVGGRGQVETRVIEGIPFSAGATWALGSQELFYYPSELITAGRFPTVRSIDLQTKVSRDLKPGDVILGRGISLSADGRWLLRSQMDRVQTMIIFGE